MSRNTCGGCTETWTGTNAAHCAKCHNSFATVGLFDRHRSLKGEHGSCLEPSTVGLELRGGLWRGPAMTAEQKAARFGGGEHA